MTAPPKQKRTYSLGAVMPHVRRAADLMGNRHGIESILGWRASAIDKMGHPAGLALDFMCTTAQGNALNADLHANAGALGLKYTIWRQTYYPVGGDSEPMADRGSPTQNHMDHVHAQFKATGGDGSTPGGAESGEPGAGEDDTAGAGLLDGWADGLLGIGLKVGAVAAGLALVVTGVKQTVKDRERAT